MINALLLLVKPVATWERICATRRSALTIFLTSLLPLLAFTAALEGYRLARWDRPGEVKPLRPLSGKEAFVYETGQVLLSVLVVLVGAKLVKSIGETFHGRHTMTQAFTTVAYGLSPLFLLRLLDAIKDMPPWISWAIGMVFSLGVLYHGLPRVMMPDPPHAFGHFLMSAFLLVLSTGLARFVTAWYLEGRFDKVERVIAAIAARLPF